MDFQDIRTFTNDLQTARLAYVLNSYKRLLRSSVLLGLRIWFLSTCIKEGLYPKFVNSLFNNHYKYFSDITKKFKISVIKREGRKAFSKISHVRLRMDLILNVMKGRMSPGDVEDFVNRSRRS